jgi:hypothetical protein
MSWLAQSGAVDEDAENYKDQIQHSLRRPEVLWTVKGWVQIDVAAELYIYES